MTRSRLFLSVAVMIGAVAVSHIALAQQQPGQGQANQPRRAQSAQAAPPAAPAAQLPNGATSINEIYADWTVDCRIVNGQKQCLLSQAQGNAQTGQRTFAIELRPPKDGKTEGTILMPFGLEFDAGAVLKLDDKNLGQGLRFSTCMPQGCLLPLSLPTASIDALKKGGKLTVASLNVSNKEPVTFTVSLNGFSAALARVSDLGK